MDMRAYGYLIFCTVVLLGCQKDLQEQPLGPPVGPDGPGPLQLLVAGDTTDMIVMNHDLTVSAVYAGGFGSLNVDLDGNMGNEITLNVRSISPTLTTSPGAFIWISSSDPDLRFIGAHTNDSLHRIVDSTLTYQQEMETWIMHVITEEGCDLNGGDVFQVDQNIFRPSVYAEGTQMDTLAALLADSVLLYHGARTYNSPLSYFNDSTALKNTRHYRNSNCFGVPLEEVFYIGFVLDGQDGPRHGYLCLEQLTGTSIKVHYTAIMP